MAEIRHQISIDGTPKQVYAALASAPGLRGWWTADATTDKKAGGNAEFGFERRQVVFRMKISRLVSGKLVVWNCRSDYPSWNGTKLTWRIAREDGATVLRFVHGGWKKTDDYFATCNTTWGELMHRLKDHVEGKNPGPRWRE